MKIEHWELINAPTVRMTPGHVELYEFNIPEFSSFHVFFRTETDCTKIYIDQYVNKESHFSLYVSHDWITNRPRWHLVAASLANMIKSYTEEEVAHRLLSLSPDDELYVELSNIERML